MVTVQSPGARGEDMVDEASEEPERQMAAWPVEGAAEAESAKEAARGSPEPHSMDDVEDGVETEEALGSPVPQAMEEAWGSAVR